MASKYQGVADLVFRGFLSTKMQIGDETLVIKSLNHHELAQISLKCPLKGSPKYYSLFEYYLIVYSLFLVGGENVLSGRPGNISELLGVVEEIPANIRQEILKEILTLQKAQDLSLKRLEAYSYEPESRHQWAAYRGHKANDSSLTGVDGSDRLGLNTHQIAWVYLNDEEDDRLKAEEQWAYSKFIASATNAKGVKKIDEKDKARLKRLEELREKVKQGEEYQGQVKIEAHTVKELRAQLEADLEGKKDLHDRIIEEYETSIQKRRADRKERFDRDMEERKRQREDAYNQISDEDLAETSSFLTVLTPAQLEQYKARKVKERFDLTARMQASRLQTNQVKNEDRQFATENIRRLVNEQGPPKSVTLPTDDNGPMPPSPTPPRVDATPRPNPRLIAPDKAPEPQTIPTQYTRSLPEGTPPGMKREERPAMAGPSQRLTRPVKPKNVKAPGHMTHISNDDEAAFFGGGGTSYSDLPKPKRNK
mgnify:CR=1 FL=1